MRKKATKINWHVISTYLLVICKNEGLNNIASIEIEVNRIEVSNAQNGFYLFPVICLFYHTEVCQL